MSTENLSPSFKPEERKRGGDLFEADAVVISSASDTAVRALVKASGSPRITLLADDVASPSFTAECSCPTFAKGTPCRHVWAVILKLEARDADFLDGKRDLETIAREAKSNTSDFKRQAYERQKERAREMRREKKAAPKPAPDRSIYPEPVREALAYFQENGFDLAADLELDGVVNAKRVLSRVFHPDKGGSHDEAITLNQNFEILRDYLNG